MGNSLKVNADKVETIEVIGKQYSRFAINTHIITSQDNMLEVVLKYVKEPLKDNDILFITEKMVACTQNRAIPMEYIFPSKIATMLSRCVCKTPAGIGLGIPQTMEMAIKECGLMRILFAAVVSVLGKAIGQRGWFYRVAGYKASSIDGPCDYTLPPYNKYVVLAPNFPDKVAKELSQSLNNMTVIIVDINDIGGTILGSSDSNLDKNLILQILKDNPLGQSCEQTPMGIIREHASLFKEDISRHDYLEA